MRETACSRISGRTLAPLPQATGPGRRADSTRSLRPTAASRTTALLGRHAARSPLRGAPASAEPVRASVPRRVALDEARRHGGAASGLEPHGLPVVTVAPAERRA